MQARSFLHRSGRSGRGITAIPLLDRALSPTRYLIAAALDSNRSIWDRISPILLLAILAALPIVAVISGIGPQFGLGLASTYLLAGFLWVQQGIRLGDRSHFWRIAILAGVAITAVTIILPESAGAAVASATGLAAVSSLVAGIRLHAPARPAPWYMLALALFLAELGHLIAVAWTIRTGDHPAAGSLVSLSGIALLPIALWRILHRRTPGSAWTVLLDSAVVSTGLALFAWVYLIAPHTVEPAATAIDQLVLLGLPIASLGATFVAVRFLLTHWPDNLVPRQIVGSALILFIAAMTATAWTAADATTPTTHVGENALWLLALVGFGSATLHPSMTQLATPFRERRSELNWPRAALLTLALLMAPFALLAQAQRGDRLTIDVLTGATAVLGLFFAARMAAIQHSRNITSAVDRRLRLAAADLVVTHGHDAIVETAIDAARAIGGRGVTTSLYLNQNEPSEYHLVHGTADGGDLIMAETINDQDLPTTTRRILAAGTSAWLSDDEIADLADDLGLHPDVRAVSIAPLGGNPGIFGLLISAGSRLNDENARHLETLAALLALALDRQRFADDSGYQPGRLARRAKAADGTAFTFVDVEATETVSCEAESDEANPVFRDVLRTDIEEDRLIARYQPRLDLTHGRIAGFEMITAWESPLVGPVPSAALSAIAAEHALSRTLRLSLLLRACRQLSAWRECHPNRNLNIIVPLSLSELDAPGLAEDVGIALADANCDSTQLILQITAATLLEASNPAIVELSAIIAIGVQIAASETGSAWSSLERLHPFSVSQYELESSLIARLDSDERAASIATHVISHAHSQGAIAVAHGIERREHWIHLRRINCNLGLGTLFSPPLDTNAVTALLNRPQQAKPAQTQ